MLRWLLVFVLVGAALWKLGDRLLFLTSPNLRGDDVAELQGGLNHIGFECGRVDGILGPRTARALQDFQHNCGLHDDGVCGPDTVRSLAEAGADLISTSVITQSAPALDLGFDIAVQES